MTLLHRFLSLALAVLCAAAPVASSAAAASPTDPAFTATEKIAPYVPRFGRTRPLVAVVGENGGTVLSDFVLPYGVLAASGVADVVSVSTQPGILKLGPIQIQADQTAVQFDARFPEGADYVFVPAVTRHDEPVLAAWVRSQAAKGATMISICNGALVLAHAGLTRGHRATGHWSTHASRLKAYPDTRWLKNTRYVADGKIVSSAGITAAMPTAVALVEAIAGWERADDVARRIGLGYWGTRHDSDAFRITLGDYVVGIRNSYFSATQTVGIAVADGVDEMALALTAEAYADTLRNEVHVVGKTPSVRTRGGLLLVPGAVESAAPRFDIALSAVDSVPAAQVPDKVLKDIAERYGPRTARFVVLDWEYPGPAPSPPAAALPQAGAEPSVGFMQLPQPDGAATTVFYPTSGTEAAVRKGPFSLSWVADGAPLEGNGRLVVISHGSGGSPWVHADLARALVRRGFTVAIPLHRGDNYLDPAEPGPVSWRRRPQEVSDAIDRVAAHAWFQGRLSLDAVGVFGGSAGGHTALSLAGGEWSDARFKSHCEKNIEQDFASCVGFLTMLNGNVLDPLKIWAARRVIAWRFTDPTVHRHRDPRITAAVAMVPFAADFVPESLARPAVHLGLVIARKDVNQVPRFHVENIARVCAPRCDVVMDLPEGSHGAMLSPMPPLERGSVGEQLLADPPSFDRERAIADLNARIGDFFVQHFKDVAQIGHP